MQRNLSSPAGVRLLLIALSIGTQSGWDSARAGSTARPLPSAWPTASAGAPFGPPRRDAPRLASCCYCKSHETAENRPAPGLR